MEIILIISGIITLFLGGEGLIKGAVHIAKNLKISELLVSSLIIGFGTSMPEMVVSVSAVLKGSSAIAIGNIVGSNIANVLLIIGVASLISPFRIKDKKIRRDVFMMSLASVLFIGFGYLNILNVFSGILFLIILITHIFYSYKLDRRVDKSNVEKKIEEGKYLNIYLACGLSVAGLLLLTLGSWLFLEGAITFARKFNISEEIIGLGIMAIGSSLPELATILIAAIKKNGNIAASGVIGSIIFNTLSIVGVVSIIDKVSISENILNLDLPLSVLIVLIFALFLSKGWNFGRHVGLVFVTSYVVYFYKLFVYIG
jgi:cation:H+ antiporter